MNQRSCVLSFGIDADASAVLKHCGVLCRYSGCSDKRLSQDSRFITVVGDNQIISAYFHQSRRHAAIVTPLTKPERRVRTEASAGEWAVAISSRDTCRVGVSAFDFWGTSSYEVM